MNIGIVTYWYERGAGYVSKIFEKILIQEHKVFIYARGGEMAAKKDPNWDHPNVYWSKWNPKHYRTYINKQEFVAWIKENSINLVIFNEQTFFEPILWCKEQNVLSVAYIDYYTEETLPLFAAYDALICNTKRHFSAFEELGNAYYIPWGTDTNLYKPKDDEAKLVEKGKVVFFNSAGMSPVRKGTDTFIKALYLCIDNPRVKAIVHSQRPLKKVLPNLTKEIDSLINSGKLQVVEKTIPAPGLYTCADVYVYPSILDGIGLTVPEALSSGLACIVSANPPMDEFVNEDCGSLIPIDRLYARKDGYYWPQCRCDFKALAKLIECYVSDDDKLVKKKKYSREYALKNLSYETNFSKLLALIKYIEIRLVSTELKKSVYSYDRNAIKRYQYLYAKSGIYRIWPLKKYLSIPHY